MKPSILTSAIVLSGAVMMTACNFDADGSTAIADRDAYFESMSGALERNLNAGISTFSGVTTVNVPGIQSDDLPNLEAFKNIYDKFPIVHMLTKRDALNDEDGYASYIDLILSDLEAYGTLTDTSGGLELRPYPPLCNKVSGDQNLCSEALNGITIEFSKTGEDSGSVALQYKDADLLILDYSLTSVSMTGVLENAKALMSVLYPGRTMPSHFAGRIKLKVDALSGDTGRVTLSIPEAVIVGDDVTSYQLKIGQTDSLLSMEGSEFNGTGRVDVDISSITLRVLDDDGHIIDLSIPSLTVNMVGDSNSTDIAEDDTLTADAVLEGSGILMAVDMEEVFSLAPLTLDASMTQGGLSFDQSLDIHVEVVDDEGYVRDIAIPQDTKLQNAECNGSSGVEVASGGPVVFSQTQDGETIQLSAAQGECFSDF